MIGAPRPLYLLGRQRLDALGRRIQDALPELARDWWLQENCIQLVGVSTWNDELRSSSIRYVVRETVDSWLVLLGTQQAWLKLAEGWLGCEVPAGGPLINTLHREFCLALYRRLAGRDAVAAVLEQGGWSEIPAHVLQPGGGALVIELDVDGVPLMLLAPIGLWEELASWPQMRPARAMQQAAAALAATTVNVDVRLPGVRIPMADMGSLAVGDFLDLEHDLSGRVRVVGERADISLPAVLGQLEGRKAVRIEHHDGGQR